jgi:hypothetical protein
MNNFKKLNNITGFVVFAIATLVYMLTAEPTASFWDCGEYIATAAKLQVGHPPGAPFFQLMARIASLFAFGNKEHVALMINLMSALFSGLTILFLFWTITAMVKKLTDRLHYAENSQLLIILFSGLIGSLAYTFSDSFWFSAVEGEVYATSSFFTAFVFWAMLKWESHKDEPGSFRWILLISFFMGLSIGVHLLNLLAIPAIALVYSFNKYKATKTSAFVAFLISMVVLAFLLYGVIPQLLELFAKTELTFVNTFKLGFNSGTLFFAGLIIVFIVSGLITLNKNHKYIKILFQLSAFILCLLILNASSSVGNFFIRFLIVAITVGLVVFYRHRREVLSGILLSVTFIIIGYSTFLILVIRSNAGTPINENAPKDAISLLSYLNRDQYGDWPIVYGPYFNAPPDAHKPFYDGEPLFAKDLTSGKYVIIDDRKNSEVNYDSRFKTIFPRMWSSSETHAYGYRSWGQIHGTPIKVTDLHGNSETIFRPTFTENMRYFLSYQVGHMYFRYFMWNFVGKQNDLQGHGDISEGNWISGIPVVDKMIEGNYDNLPQPMKANKGRNYYFFLPFLLGFAGFFMQLFKDSKSFLITFLLFIFTGFAIVIYLNSVPFQPRERDYAFVASFYAFAIWIGIGVVGLFHFAQRIMNPRIAAFLVFIICAIAVPANMARQGWDDHDRSGRYNTRDMAADYLNSCEPNAILFTLGDNDTFPLWYAQEIEGIRTDVRVVNLSLLNMDWYIDQMKRKFYDSDPLPISLKRESYLASRRDGVFLYDDTTLVKPSVFADLKSMIAFAAQEDEFAKLNTTRGQANYMPTHNFMIPADSAACRNLSYIPDFCKDSVRSHITWTLTDYAIQKNNLIALDILANNNWKRPIYFAVTTGDDAYLNLFDYLQLEGYAYRLVPYKVVRNNENVGMVNSEIMYNNMMHKFKMGQWNNPDIYLDETQVRTGLVLRKLFSRLALQLAIEGQTARAVEVCDKSLSTISDNCIPYDDNSIPLIEAYLICNKKDAALTLGRTLLAHYRENLIYYHSFKGSQAFSFSYETKLALLSLQKIYNIAVRQKNTTLQSETQSLFKQYSSKAITEEVGD